jgi:PGAP1-like protein.
LIGASLGGLVARASLSHLERSEAARALITLACPHQGTRLARWAPSTLFPLLRSLVYQGKAIQELEHKEAAVTAVARVPKTAFFSDMDELVRPATALHPPAGQGWSIKRTRLLSHMSIMLDKATVNGVLRELERFSAESS